MITSNNKTPGTGDIPMPFLIRSDGSASERVDIHQPPLRDPDWIRLKQEAERQGDALFWAELRSVALSIFLVSLPAVAIAVGIWMSDDMAHNAWENRGALLLFASIFILYSVHMVAVGEGFLLKPRRQENPLGALRSEAFDAITQQQWSEVRQWILADTEAQPYVKEVLRQYRPLYHAEYWTLQARSSELIRGDGDPQERLREELQS